MSGTTISKCLLIGISVFFAAGCVRNSTDDTIAIGTTLGADAGERGRLHALLRIAANRERVDVKVVSQAAALTELNSPEIDSLMAEINEFASEAKRDCDARRPSREYPRYDLHQFLLTSVSLAFIPHRAAAAINASELERVQSLRTVYRYLTRSDDRCFELGFCAAPTPAAVSLLPLTDMELSSNVLVADADAIRAFMAEIGAKCLDRTECVGDANLDRLRAQLSPASAKFLHDLDLTTFAQTALYWIRARDAEIARDRATVLELAGDLSWEMPARYNGPWNRQNDLRYYRSLCATVAKFEADLARLVAVRPNDPEIPQWRRDHARMFEFVASFDTERFRSSMEEFDRYLTTRDRGEISDVRDTLNRALYQSLVRFADSSIRMEPPGRPNQSQTIARRPPVRHDEF